METVSISEVWAWVAAILGGWILIVNGAEKAAKVYRTAKAPNETQDKRLQALEEHVQEIDLFLANDKKRLDSVDEGNRVTQRALLALLDHALDGNNIKQMEDAKQELRNHLINR